MKRLALFLAVLSFTLRSTDAKVNILLAGDSTCAEGTVGATPYRGWGQLFQCYFDENEVQIHNFAKGGCSTKTFREKGKWDELIAKLSKGDIVTIQFGHNDWNTDASDDRFTTPAKFEENLKTFVNEVREKGGQPILLTPIASLKYDANGKPEIAQRRKAYIPAIQRAASELEVPMIDVQQFCVEWLATMDPETAAEYFNWMNPGDYEKYPKGKKDNVHLNQKGAYEVGIRIGRALCELKPELTPFFKEASYSDIEAKFGPIKTYRKQ